MNIKELKEIINDYPDDMLVIIRDRPGYSYNYFPPYFHVEEMELNTKDEISDLVGHHDPELDEGSTVIEALMVSR